MPNWIKSAMLHIPWRHNGDWDCELGNSNMFFTARFRRQFSLAIYTRMIKILIDT